MRTLIQVFVCFFYLQWSFVTAFPSGFADNEVLYRKLASTMKSEIRKRGILPIPTLVDTTKPIKVSGDHLWKAPGPTDRRGPCPGLNALANHGYIPRTGIAPFAGTLQAINQVMGMEIELATLLAVMGVVFAGNPLSTNPSFSIDAVDNRVENLLNNIFGLVSEPQGLNGSHNIIESDASNTREDLYISGDASTMKLELFEEWYNMSEDEYDMDLMAKRSSIRVKQCIATNPYFYYGPVTGLLVHNAGFIFGGRLLANHSGTDDATPHMTRNVMKSFWGVEGEPGSFVYKRGHERIPENWYRTPVEYGLVDLNLDCIAFGLKYPELFNIGGNTGTVNSFAGLDLKDITGGVFNSANLLENNNLICFVLEVIKTLVPDILGTIFKVVGEVVGMVNSALPILSLNCPVWDDLTAGGSTLEDLIRQKYPGAARSGIAW